MQKKEMRREDVTLYIAANLFNAPATFFNQALVKELEEKGYNTKFPQRDGFEFGDLYKALKTKLPESKIQSAIESIIYYLDMGVFIPQSHIIVANLDEPQDEGVLVELSHAKNIHRQTIGFRTDVRSPYGSPSDEYAGMHFFPGMYSCDSFILYHMPCRNPKEAKEQMKNLATLIDNDINPKGCSYIDPKTNHPLFKNIEDIHSEEGLIKIVNRYLKHEKMLSENGPKITRG